MSRGLRHARTVALLLCGFLGAMPTARAISGPAGFVRFDLPPQSQTLVSMPLEPFASSASNVLAGQLTSDDRVLTWDASRQIYVPAAPSNLTLVPGEAFWIENHQPTGEAVFLFGRVVLDEQVNRDLQPLLNVFGLPYATASGEWLLGQGYWFDNLQTQVVTWAVSRPYEDIFDLSSEDPSIEGLAVAPGGVKLTIDTAGLDGSTLAVLYQDLAPTGVLDTTRGWVIAEPNFTVTANEMEWVDTGTPDRAAPSAVFARLYLVVRADMDANQNGVPDLSERESMGTISISASAREAGSGSSSSDAASEVDAAEQGIAQESPSTNAAPPGFLIFYKRPIVYVDAVHGDDSFTGERPYRAAQEGPKKTIRAGLAAARERDTVVIRDGAYGEDMNIAGRDVDVRIEGNVNLSGPARAHVELPRYYTNSAGKVERMQQP